MPRTPRTGPSTAAQHRSGPLGGRTRRALTEAVEGSLKHDARPAGADPSWPVLAEIARGVADMADEARRVKDARGYMAAVKELRPLLDELLGVQRDGRAGGGGQPAPDDRPEGVAGILGSGPEMGDTAQP